MSDLPACPFCASTDSISDYEVVTMRPFVACSNCGTSVPAPNEDPTPEGARRMWNTRNGVLIKDNTFTQGEVT